MAVDYTALRDLDLTELRDRVAAWTAVATAMTDAESLYASDVHAGMGSQDWTGAAADHAGTRSTELHGLITAGRTEAAAVRDILTEAVERFGAAQTALSEAVAQVDAIEQLQITDAGKVEFKPGVEAGEPLAVALFSHHITELQDQVDTALDDAQTADDEIAGALRLAAETADPADNTFNGHALDLAELERVRADADEAVELFATDMPPSPENLEQINRLLSDNAGNPVFAQRLLSALGPAELLAHTGAINGDWQGQDAETDAETLELLGRTLATATDPDGQPHLDREWTGDFMTEAANSGYLDAAPLLAHGEYHEDFIVPVAEHMLRLEPLRDQLGLATPSSYDDSPLTTALEAVHRNPDAALSLMTGSQAYQDLPYEFGGEELEPREDNLTAMLDLAAEDAGLLDPDTAGNVVEAAATGTPAGTPESLPRVEHTAAMAGVTERLIAYVGGDPTQVDAPGAPLNPIMDNLASVTDDYIEDFHRAFIDEEARSGWQPQSHGHPLGLGEYSVSGQQDLKQYLQVLGHDEAASRLVWESSLGVTAHNIESAVLEPENHREGAAEDAVEPHARMMAEITNGRLEAVRDDAFAAADEHNRNVGYAEEVVSRTGSELLGKVPLAGGALSEGWGHVTGGVFSNFRQDEIAAAIEGQSNLLAELNPRYTESVEPMITAATRDSGLTDDQIAGVLAHAGQEYEAALRPMLCPEDGRLPGPDGECPE